MFHHRSCGTAQLVALMAAHRDARRDATGLRQQSITRLAERLEYRGAAVAWPHSVPADAKAPRRNRVG